MPFKKGQIGNPNGRPKGGVNKISAEQREYLRDFLMKNKEKFEEHVENLKSKDYVLMYIALMQYILPKPATAELREVPKLEEFVAMTSEERQEAIREIRESLQNQ
jgi:hypothetical protein